MKDQAIYSSEHIQNLQFPDDVRMNASLYLGSVDAEGRWLVARELLDNGLDEFLAKRNDAVHLYEEQDDSYTVIDNGYGIPQGTKEYTVYLDGKSIKSSIPTMQAIFGQLNTSGKYRSEAYKVSIGSHGQGSKSSNATSEFFHVKTCYQGKWYEIEFKQGHLTIPVRECEQPIYRGKPLQKGTMIHFKHDKEIFGTVGIDFKLAESWAEITSYLNPGFHVTLQDKHNRIKEYYSEQGPSEYVEKLIDQLKAQREEQLFTFKNELCDIVVAFSNAENCNVRGYTNGLYNSDGGKHVDSVCQALFNIVKDFAKSKQTVQLQDFKEGLVGIINMHLHKAEFSSQDKLKLTDDRAGDALRQQIQLDAEKFFKKNKELALRLCEKSSKLSELRSQFKASKKMIAALNQAKKRGMPAKYSPFDSKTKVEDRELLIVEGLSAAGGLRQVRKPYQSLYPIKGKIKNLAKTTEQIGLESEEIINILSAIGYDPNKENPMANPTVGKIICLADADEDGCFKASSFVKLCDGTSKTFKELADQWEKDHQPIWVWSLDAQGKLHPAKAYEPSIRCYRDKEVHVHLDSGDEIVCTLQHPFAINYCNSDKAYIDDHDMKYLQAQYLQPGDLIASIDFEDIKQLTSHKVIKTEIVELKAAEPFYCLTVPQYGNFLLADKSGNGICSSNCHINTLLLTLFFKICPQLFEKGMIYVADMYDYYAMYKDKVIVGNSAQEVLDKLHKIGAPNSITASHCKGWGEMMNSVLKVLAVDKETRRLIRIKPITDHDRTTFVRIMNDDVEYRRQMLGLADNV